MTYVCSDLHGEYDCSFGIDDPTGKSDGEFLKAMEEIKEKVLKL